MLSFLFALINPLATVATEIAKAKIAMANAQTDQEKIAAEERVKTLEARRDMLIERGKLQAEEAKVSPLNIIMRAVLTAPIAILLWKVYVWDKALGQWTGGRTDALSPELWQVVMAVVGFYFLYEATTTVARIIKR